MRGFESCYSCLKKILRGKRLRFNRIRNIRSLLHLTKKNDYCYKKKYLLLINNYSNVININNFHFFSFKKHIFFINSFYVFKYENVFFFTLNYFYNKNNINFFCSKIKIRKKFNLFLTLFNFNLFLSKTLTFLSNHFFFTNNNLNLNFLNIFKYLFNMFNLIAITTKIKNQNLLNNFFRNNIIKSKYKIQLKKNNLFNKNQNEAKLLFQNLLNLKTFKKIKIKKLKKITSKNLFFHYFYKSKIYYKNLTQRNIKNLLNIFKILRSDSGNNIIKLSKASINFYGFNFILNNSLIKYNFKKNNFKILYFLNRYFLNTDSFKYSTKPLLSLNYFNYLNFFKKTQTKVKTKIKITKNNYKNNSNSELILIKNNNTITSKKNKFIVDKFHTYFKSNFCKFTINYNFTKLEFLFFVFFKPLFFKFVLISNPSLNFLWNFSILNDFKNYFFYSRNNFYFSNNLIPNKKFNYILKKKIIKIFDHDRVSLNTTQWYHETLIRFLENYSGNKIYFKIFPFLNNNLNFFEKTQCLLWSQKIKYFRKVLGPRLFLNESLQIIYLSLKLKDPIILSNWMVSTMRKISFWKFKTFLRYIKYVLRYFFWTIFKEINVKGIKFQLKGKISVAGNSRTRTAFHYVGFTSHTTFDNKILYTLNLVKTFTGVLGFKLWIVF